MASLTKRRRKRRRGKLVGALTLCVWGRVRDFRSQLSSGIAPILAAREFYHRDNIRPPRQGLYRAASFYAMQPVSAQDPAARIPANILTDPVEDGALVLFYIFHLDRGWK